MEKITKKRIIIGSITLVVLLTLFILYIFTKNNKEETLADDNANEVQYALDFPNDSSLASIEDYQYWKASIFPIDAYNVIPQHLQRAIVKIFMNNKFTTSGEYFLTKIENRAKNIFAFGNFTGRKEDEKQDLAFLVEESDYQSSGLFIISHEGHLLFWKKFENELPVINSFSKESKIFMNEMKLVLSPLDGLIIKFKDRKEVLLYDSKTKTFESFYQYTKDDITSADDEIINDIEEQNSTKISL